MTPVSLFVTLTWNPLVCRFHWSHLSHFVSETVLGRGVCSWFEEITMPGTRAKWKVRAVPSWGPKCVGRGKHGSQSLSNTLKNVPRQHCRGWGRGPGLSTKTGPFSPNFFSSDVSSMVWSDSGFGMPPLPLLCMSAISQISSLGHFLKSSPTCAFFFFFQISKGILFQASAVKWGTRLWTVAHLTVTSEFPMGTRLSTRTSKVPFDSRFKNNAEVSPDLTDGLLLEPIAAGPQIAFEVGSRQGLSAKNPLGTSSPFQDPIFKQIKVFSSCWWKPEVQVKVNECGILKEAGRRSKDLWVDLSLLLGNSFPLFPTFFSLTHHWTFPSAPTLVSTTPIQLLINSIIWCSNSLRCVHVPKQENIQMDWSILWINVHVQPHLPTFLS